MTTDRYTGFVSGGFGRSLSQRLGLPQPVTLRRYAPDQPLLDGPIALWSATTNRWARSPRSSTTEGLEVASDDDSRLAAIVLDACGAADPASLDTFPTVIGPALKRLRPCGRVVVIGRPPESIDDPARAAAQRALRRHRPIHRQGAASRRHGQPRAGCRRRRAQRRVDAALPALVPVGVRRRSGAAGRHGNGAPDRLGETVAGQGRRGHRSRPRHRCRDRGRPGPGRCHGGRGGRAGCG